MGFFGIAWCGPIFGPDHGNPTLFVPTSWMLYIVPACRAESGEILWEFHQTILGTMGYKTLHVYIRIHIYSIYIIYIYIYR